MTPRCWCCGRRALIRLASERIVTPAGVVAGTVVVDEGVVRSVSPGDGGAVDLELGRRWLVPGFVDTHVHGGGGAQCNTASPEEVAAVAAFHARHGTTALLATLVSAPVDALVGSLSAVTAAVAAGAAAGGGARVLGAHVEGPFVSRDAPGAMDPATFLAPSVDVLRRLLRGGGARMMTLAPELPGAVEVVGELARAGVVASLGHSRAGHGDAVAAVRAGARSATHLFNAMAPFHHRAPGLVGAALECEEVNCELICDGVHVDAAALRVALACKGTAGVRLVTDAVAACGMGDGSFRLGSTPVTVAGGRAYVQGREDVLAGSTLTMDAAVANAVRLCGVSVPDAVAMASSVPARVLGLGDRLGAIAPGYAADLAVLGDDLRACATMVAGEWVVAPPA